jgi:16S rRNA (adenine1518-N6/adenine1519-N6)-dimethyltransferase
LALRTAKSKGGAGRGPSPDSLRAEVKRRLRSLGLHARKGLGQHFLVDGKALTAVVAAAELGPEDTVLEVGSGLGTLTAELARRAGKVVAVELDPALASALRESFAAQGHVSIVHADILATEPGALASGDYKVVANIPYYITSPILRHFLEAEHKPQLMVLTVQKEVAQSIVASPSHGRVGLLGISVQFYGRPRIVRYIPAGSFYPPPQVDSAILRIEVLPRPAVEVEDVAMFFEVVRAGFSAPRKQIHNSLAQGIWLPPGGATPLLEEAGIDPRRRPQTLALEEWARLCRAFARQRPSVEGQSHEGA